LPRLLKRWSALHANWRLKRLNKQRQKTKAQV
jgi:hypothetical protein